MNRTTDAELNSLTSEESLAYVYCEHTFPAVVVVWKLFCLTSLFQIKVLEVYVKTITLFCLSKFIISAVGVLEQKCEEILKNPNVSRCSSTFFDPELQYVLEIFELSL